MTRRLALLTLLGVLAACASDASTTAVTTTTSSSASTTAPACEGLEDQTDVPYVEDGGPLQQLDLYLPTDPGCAPVPLVVWVHGGGWRIGDKTNAMADKVQLWNDAGWAVASVNYRLTDPGDPAADRVMAPAHNEDVAAALGWLVDHAAETGVDPDHIALLGHSAGAAIVAALATDPTYLEADGIEPADLSCVAPLDTEGFSIETGVGVGGEVGAVYTDAFGTDPTTWAELSPLTHVGDAALPDLLLVTRGTARRREAVATFREAVEAAGGNVTVVDLPRFTHEDVNKQIGEPDDATFTPALQDFLTTCLTS